MVRAGKVRYLGISNCSCLAAAKANALAEREGFAPFVSVQNHYNLIFREEEREMAPLCAQDRIAMTPYSALASGRLSRHPGETTQRMREDDYARLKYDAAAQQDQEILRRVAEVARLRGVTMYRGRPGLAVGKGYRPGGGGHEALPRGGAARRWTSPLPEERAYLEAPYGPPRPGGGHGPEHPRGRRGGPRLVRRGPDHLMLKSGETPLPQKRPPASPEVFFKSKQSISWHPWGSWDRYDPRSNTCRWDPEKRPC